MKYLQSLVIAVPILLLFATDATAQTWCKDSLGASCTDPIDNPSVGSRTKEIHFHIPNVSTTNSNSFVIQEGYEVSVRVNAHVESTGANGVLLTLECFNDTISETANNHFTVENTTLTGVGPVDVIWDVPEGKCFISVTDGPDAGTAAVTVRVTKKQ